MKRVRSEEEGGVGERERDGGWRNIMAKKRREEDGKINVTQ